MVKKISTTISDYTWETYLLDFKGNRSEFIETMFLKGIDADAQGNIPKFKQQVLILKEKNKNLSKELHTLKRLNAEYLRRLDYREQKEKEKQTKLNTQKAINMRKGLKRSGLIRDMILDAENE